MVMNTNILPLVKGIDQINVYYPSYVGQLWVDHGKILHHKWTSGQSWRLCNDINFRIRQKK